MARRYYLSVVSVIGQFLFLYGFLGWAYGVLFQVTYPPEWLHFPLSHLTTWIRVDTFTVLSFAASGVGFLVWRLAKEFADSADKSPA